MDGSHEKRNLQGCLLNLIIIRENNLTSSFKFDNFDFGEFNFFFCILNGDELFFFTGSYTDFLEPFTRSSMKVAYYTFPTASEVLI